MELVHCLTELEQLQTQVEKEWNEAEQEFKKKRLNIDTMKENISLLKSKIHVLKRANRLDTCNHELLQTFSEKEIAIFKNLPLGIDLLKAMKRIHAIKLQYPIWELKSICEGHHNLRYTFQSKDGTEFITFEQK